MPLGNAVHRTLISLSPLASWRKQISTRQPLLYLHLWQESMARIQPVPLVPLQYKLCRPGLGPQLQNGPALDLIYIMSHNNINNDST